MQWRRRLAIGLLLLFLLPVNNAYSQTQDDEELDFVNALVFMVANDDLTSDPLEIGEMRAIRDHVTNYYDRCIDSAKQGGSDYQHLVNHWELERQRALDQLNPKINQAVKQTYTRTQWFDFLIDYLPWLDVFNRQEKDPKLSGTIVHGASAVQQIENQDSSALNDADQNVQDFQAQVMGPSHAAAVVDTLVIRDAGKLPDTTEVISGLMDDGYVYNQDPGVGDQTLDGDPISDASSQLTGGDPSQPAGDEVVSKPIRFNNTGTTAVTVSVVGYQGYGAFPGGASTVVFPESSSAAMLELPVGDYRFCYYWDTGEDADEDGYVDYRHAETGMQSLTNDSPDDPSLAKTVTVSPGSVSASEGKCQRPLVDGGTEAEKFHQGTHTFEGLCTYWDGDQETNRLTITMDYNDAAVVMSSEEDSESYEKIGPNSYENFSGDILVVVTMVESGFRMHIEGYGYHADCDYRRVD